VVALLALGEYERAEGRERLAVLLAGIRRERLRAALELESLQDGGVRDLPLPEPGEEVECRLETLTAGAGGQPPSSASAPRAAASRRSRSPAGSGAAVSWSTGRR
jgi:hypothetical protein